MSTRPHLPYFPSTDGARISAVLGDITQQTDCDAIVNAANTGLRKGSGVCGAIYRAAGPDLETYTDRLEPIQVGEAIITPGFRLPNAWVIHVAGPRYGVDGDSAGLVAKAMRNVLEYADATKVVRLAVPAMSTGIYGYPVDEAGPILIKENSWCGNVPLRSGAMSDVCMKTW